MADTILLQARDLMQRALDLLDEAGSVHDVGAHLDLALARLSEVIADSERAFGNDNVVLVDSIDQPSPGPANS